MASGVLRVRGPANYSGVVVADVAGIEEQHAIEVTYDGVNMGWKIQ